MTESSSHEPAPSMSPPPSENTVGTTSAWWRRVPLWVVWTFALTLLLVAVIVSVVVPVWVEVQALHSLRAIKGVQFLSSFPDEDRSTTLLRGLRSQLFTPWPHFIEFGPETPREALAWLSRIRVVHGLCLRSRRLRDDDLALVARLPRLEYLGFTAPGLTADGFRHLAGMSVSTVDFRHSTIPAGALTTVAGLRGLISLDIQFSTFEERDFSAFRHHPGLVWLSFQSVDLTGEDLATIGTLPALKFLTLDRAGVTNEELARLPDTLAVHQLTLSGPEFTDESLAGLRVDPESLVIKDTGITFGESTEAWFKSRKRCFTASIDQKLTPERLKHLNSLGKVHVEGKMR
jgi:hypothetical protein